MAASDRRGQLATACWGKKSSSQDANRGKQKYAKWYHLKVFLVCGRFVYCFVAFVAPRPWLRYWRTSHSITSSSYSTSDLELRSMDVIALRRKNPSMATNRRPCCWIIYSKIHPGAMDRDEWDFEIYPSTKAIPNRNIPSRELTYPIKMAFWRWFSFSQGGIC